MISNFNRISKTFKSKFFFDYDLSSSTWFRTGGKADLFCIVSDEEELKIILENLNNETPLFIIGVGSNVLIRDGGFRGLIIKLGKAFNKLYIKNTLISAGAGILDTNLSKYAYNNSIEGLEFFSGIPGSIGGAIKMNAGCFGNSTKDVVKEISVYNKNGIKNNLSNNEIGFSYRNSKLSDDYIVTSVILEGRTGEKKDIETKIKEIKFKREVSQPLKTQTSGSTFKNPTGLYAAKLIEQADCKGLKVGDAVVSNKHSNFFINLGRATSSDIENLGKLVQNKVMQKMNILLEWEIKLIGEPLEK